MAFFRAWKGTLIRNSPGQTLQQHKQKDENLSDNYKIYGFSKKLTAFFTCPPPRKNSRLESHMADDCNTSVNDRYEGKGRNHA
uniref:Ovule protein n=1 Tax=Angiostrongylus cantonensis TaxID=6313 RepID=A0A0K0CWR9_ANGCA